MATFDAYRELDFMHGKLLHYGQYRWLNVILVSWEKAYRKAYGNVVKTLEKKASEEFGAADVLGVFIGQGSVGIQLVFAPLVGALKELNAVEPSFPAAPAKSPEEFIADRRLEFGRMLESCSAGILKLAEKARLDGSFMTEDKFDKFRSRALLSPIWYPPKEPDVETLANRIEMRMWAKIAQAIVDGYHADLKMSPFKRAFDSKMGTSERIMRDRDYSAAFHRMAVRLEELKAVKNTTAGVFAGMAAPLQYLSGSLKPWVAKELSRPDPFDYPLPSHVNNYLALVKVFWIKSFMTFRRLNIDEVMRVIPNVRLNWSHVP